MGQQIYTLNPESLLLEKDTFLGFLDFQNDTQQDFLVIKSGENSTILEVTADHVMYAIISGVSGYYFAQELQPGDIVLHQAKHTAIHSIHTTQHLGSAAPLTSSGHIYVDHTLASNYALNKNQPSANLAFSFYKSLPSALQSQYLLDLYLHFLKYLHDSTLFQYLLKTIFTL